MHVVLQVNSRTLLITGFNVGWIRPKLVGPRFLHNAVGRRSWCDFRVLGSVVPLDSQAPLSTVYSFTQRERQTLAFDRKP